MLIAITTILIVLIICVSVLLGIHMFICSENEIGMYADPKYEGRISNLEKLVKEKGEK